MRCFGECSWSNTWGVFWVLVVDSLVFRCLFFLLCCSFFPFLFSFHVLAMISFLAFVVSSQFNSSVNSPYSAKLRPGDALQLGQSTLIFHVSCFPRASRLSFRSLFLSCCCFRCLCCSCMLFVVVVVVADVFVLVSAQTRRKRSRLRSIFSRKK